MAFIILIMQEGKDKEMNLTNKRTIFLILILGALILSGCSHSNNVSSNNSQTHQIQEPQNDEPGNVAVQKQFMNRPAIILESGHSYGDSESWIGEDIVVTGDSLKTSGDSIFIEIIFDTKIYYENVRDKIKLIGCDCYEIENNTIKENALRILARDIETDKIYKLFIPKSVTDTKGNPLEDDVIIEILLETEANAFYTFVGHEVQIDDLGESTDDFNSLHISLPVTNKTIEFIVDFTQNVDKESVENAIRKGLNNEGQIIFEWANNQKLKLQLENLSANKEYVVSMKEANVIGSLFFTVFEPTQLSSVNLQTRDNNLLKEFIDLPYLVVPSADYERFFLVDDAKKKYVADVEKNLTTELQSGLMYTFGSPYYEFYSNWLNSHTVLAFEEESNSIFTHDFISGEIKKIFTLPLKIEDIYDIKLSPDKNMIAVTNIIAVTDINYEMNLYVFSLKGETLLFKGVKAASNHMRHDYTVSMYLQWLDDNTIIFQDDKDIVKLDITTNSKETIIKDAQEPIVCQNSDYLLVKKPKDDDYRSFLYNMNTYEEIDLGSEISNLFMIDENKYLYNQSQDIVVFDISQNKKETLGRGEITGVSPDKKRVYYVNNCIDSYYLFYPE